MKNNYSFLITLLIVLLVASCISIKKQTYFHGDINNSDSVTFAFPIHDYLLRPGDILSIKVASLDERLTEFINVNRSPNAQIQAQPDNLYVQGYLVDDSGYVELPIIGKFMAKGATLSQFRVLLSNKINSEFAESTVIIKLVNIKVTVTGEVNRPSVYYFPNERISIIEALSGAGDLTLTGKRSSIEILRQKVDGTFERGYLNLNDVNVVHSPYFYLYPNDIVYVPPTRTLAARFNVTSLTVLFTGISALVLVLTYVNK